MQGLNQNHAPTHDACPSSSREKKTQAKLSPISIEGRDPSAKALTALDRSASWLKYRSKQLPHRTRIDATAVQCMSYFILIKSVGYQGIPGGGTAVQLYYRCNPFAEKTSTKKAKLVGNYEMTTYHTRST